MTNLQEQHWEKLFAFLTTEGQSMYGIWTVYSPAKEIIKSSQGIRNLRPNADKTVITHTNHFPLPDGTTLEKQWEIHKETCNQPDGLLHPADPSKRALALVDYGSSTWLPTKVESGRTFSVELFLKHQDWNTSIGSIYTENGDLEKILHLREHLNSFPDSRTSEEITSISGTWIGTKESITSDLKVSEREEISEIILDPTNGKNETFYLPNSVVLNIPKKLPIGEEFEIVAGKFFAENEYKRLTAKYDDSGAFTLLISEVFRLQD
ncbi:MAG: DUF3598 family protein [Nostoc sp.]|uniref:DUF3598 family protein n=1 Tax=Nostoc sp. TaxID=1180 RepID=UPI002FFB68F8